MARPRKEGMEYFPHDTDARNDLKIRKLRAVFGNDGYATYFILLENIYRNKSYEMDISDAETMLILAEECKISEEKLSQIILKCLELDLFSKEMYKENKILTSQAIKKRTEPVENKRKKNNSDYNNRKSEVSDSETDDNNGVSDAEIPTESTQSKEKNSKEKKTTVVSDFNIYNMFTTNGFGTISSIMREQIDDMVNQFTSEWVQEAIKEAVRNNVRKISYVDSILKRWNANGGIRVKQDKPKETRPNAGAYKVIDY